MHQPHPMPERPRWRLESPLVRLVLCSVTSSGGLALRLLALWYPVVYLVLAVLPSLESPRLFPAQGLFIPMISMCGAIGFGIGLGIGQQDVIRQSGYRVRWWSWATAMGTMLGLVLGWATATQLVPWDPAWEQALFRGSDYHYARYLRWWWMVFGPIFGSVLGLVQLAGTVRSGWPCRRWLLANLGAGLVGGVCANGIIGAGLLANVRAGGMNWLDTYWASPFVFAAVVVLVTTLVLPRRPAG